MCGVAAGKGTFGTEELTARIGSSGLERVVSNREVISSAAFRTRVAAHQVRKFSGFKGHFRSHPSRRSACLFRQRHEGDRREMRFKTFSTWSALFFIPVELVEALKAALVIAPIS